MKKLLLILSSLISVSSFSQTADEIVQKYTANIGGLEGFNNLTSAKMTGMVETQGMSLPLTMQVLNHKGMKLEIEVMSQQIVTVYYNGTGWKINPFEGVETATDLSEKEANEVKPQASLANQLADYKSRGHKVELAGQEKVEGVDCYHLILIAKEDSRQTDYFISSGNYQLLKSSTIQPFKGADASVETFYSNFKEFNGLKFAMTRTSKVEGNVIREINYSSVELNTPIDENIFKK